MDFKEGLEMGESLSPSSPITSSSHSPGSEARSAGSALLLSSSEEVDVESIKQVSPPHSHQYEELVEVLTRAVAKLNIDWPAECHVEPQRSKLEEWFLRVKPPPPRLSLLFFLNLHTEESKSWTRLFWPASSSPPLITMVM